MATSSTALAEDYTPSGIQIRIIDELQGRGLFSTREFNAGDVIFDETPLVSCQFLWNAAYGYLACDFCMRPLETAAENVRRLAQNDRLSLPHPECCETRRETVVQCPSCDTSYCSEGCRDKAWQQHHKILCLKSFTVNPSHPLVMLQEKWKHIHYPPETASITLLTRILATVRQSVDAEATVGAFNRFCHRTANEEEAIAHKLLGDEFQGQLEGLRELLEKALGGPDVQQWLTPEGFRSFVALVGTNGQGIGTSPFSRWVNNCDALELPEGQKEALDGLIESVYEQIDKESGTFLNTEGSGLYVLQSVCNHSCLPNATATFPGNDHRLVLVAARDIPLDTEICLSYLDECQLERSRHSRQKLLRENYLFNCHCEKCEEQSQEEDVTSGEEMEEDEEESD